MVAKLIINKLVFDFYYYGISLEGNKEINMQINLITYDVTKLL